MLLINGVFVLCKMLTSGEAGWRAHEHPILYLQVFHNLKLLFKNKSFERHFLPICWAKDPESKKDKCPTDPLGFLPTEALLRYQKFSLFFGYMPSLFFDYMYPLWTQSLKAKVKIWSWIKSFHPLAMKYSKGMQNKKLGSKNKSDYCFNLLKRQDKKINCYCISGPWLLRKPKELE